MPCTCPVAVSLALTLPLAAAPAPMCPRPLVGEDVRAALVGQAPSGDSDRERTLSEALRAIAPDPKRRTRR